MYSFNPYYSGRWSRTLSWTLQRLTEHLVLILVVVEDGLVQEQAKGEEQHPLPSLNPCCSGRWSRTIHS